VVPQGGTHLDGAPDRQHHTHRPRHRPARPLHDLRGAGARASPEGSGRGGAGACSWQRPEGGCAPVAGSGGCVWRPECAGSWAPAEGSRRRAEEPAIGRAAAARAAPLCHLRRRPLGLDEHRLRPAFALRLLRYTHCRAESGVLPARAFLLPRACVLGAVPIARAPVCARPRQHS